MSTLSPSQVDSLAGSYRFIVIATVVAARPSHAAATWHVVLERPDSAALVRARARPWKPSSRMDLRLVGSRRREGSQPDRVEWDDGLLIFGCRECEHRTSELFMIESVGRDGFSGSWITIPPFDDMSGISISPTSEEPRLRTGHFCAVRTER